MKLNSGFVTHRLQETRDFYRHALGFGITFENDWYLLMNHGGKGRNEIAFMLPDQPSQHPMFQKEFSKVGAWLTLEVENVDRYYEELREKAVPAEFAPKDEPWGDRHFAIVDPNGIAIDIVHFTHP